MQSYLFLLAAAFAAAPAGAQTCLNTGPYRQGDCRPEHVPTVPNAPLLRGAPMGDSTTGFFFEQQSGPPMRAWYSFNVADFYGSLVHVGATLPALNAMDISVDGQIWYVRPGMDWGVIDSEGAATPRGGMQSDGDYDFLLDLAIDPVTGGAYVATIKNLPDDAISKLYRLDLQTGAMTLVGEMGLGWITTLAFNCQGELFAEDVRDDTLYRVDPQTAVRTAIGPTGIDAQFDNSISFDKTDGSLYSIAYFGNGINAWGRFDTTTGAFTQIAQDPATSGYFRGKLNGSCPVQGQTFTVTPSVGTPSGAIAPDVPLTVEAGDTRSFTLTPYFLGGYRVADVGGTCGGTLTPQVPGELFATYTTNAVTADCTVIVNFEVDDSQTIEVTPSPVAITLDAGASGTGTLTVKNTGVGSGILTYSIAEAAAKARTPNASKRALLDAARGHFPRDLRQAAPIGAMHASEPKLAPRASAVSASPKIGSSLPFGTAVNGFAQNTGAATLVSLDMNTPGTLTDVGSANDQPFWGSAFLNGDSSKLYMLGDSGLFSVDTGTGVATEISGSAGGGDVWGMTVDPVAQKLYWIGPTSDQELSTVDAVTGATTRIGAITGASAGNVINAIAADAQGRLYGIDRDTDSLVSIDKTNGDTAVIGSLGVNATNLSGLAFDPASGTLYFSNASIGVFIVNVTTGQATAVGTTQDNAQLVALAIPGSGTPACENPSDVPWLSVSPASGSLARGISRVSTVTVDASTLAAGSYSANLCVTSNDLANPLVTVPVNVTVQAVVVEPCSNGDKIFCDGFDGAGSGPSEQPVKDPSLEATTGDSEENPNWTGVDDNSSGGTPFWTSGSTTLGDGGAHTGDFVAWGGGWVQASSQHWLQSVTIASGSPRYLNFWRKIDQLPMGGTATLMVSVDGTALSTLDVIATGLDAEWVNVSIDVSAYADDAAHEIRFDYAATGSDDGDVYIDDMTIDATEGSRRR